MRINRKIRGFAMPGLALCVQLLSLPSAALEQRTPHTFALGPGEVPPAATLDALGILIGSWEGEAFGGRFEEAWNPPTAGSMVGMFKLYGDDGVAFYELMLITVDDGVVTLKVKHFNPDFSAWEESAGYVGFRLVGVEDDALHFSGISFYRRSADEMHAYLVLRNGDEIREELLVYRRRK